MYKIMQDGFCYAKDIENLNQARLEARGCLSLEDEDIASSVIVDQETGKEIERLTLEVSIEEL